MKRVVFLIGVGLLAMAFLVTSAELAARVILGSQNGGGEAWMSTLLVWRTVAPHSFLMLHNNAYWPILQHLLALPGWILFGLPGLTLGILFRNRETDESIRQHDQAYEDSLFLYDQLTVAAKEEGYGDGTDDFAFGTFEDTVPAEQHFAEDPIEDKFLPERDFLLSVSKTADPNRSDLD